MKSAEIKIFELYIEENVFNIGLRVRGKYNSKVRKPVLTVIFDDGIENRIMSMPIQAYYPDESLTNYDFFAAYKYNINYLFFHTDVPDNLSVKIEVTYGEELYTDVVYEFSKDLVISGSDSYRIGIAKDKKSICINKVSGVNSNSIGNKSLFVVQEIIKFIWSIVLAVLSIITFPIFLAEAILSLIGCAPEAPKNNQTGLMKVVFHVRWRVNFITRKYLGFGDIKIRLAKFSFFMFRLFKVKDNRVTFISNRRDKISGNYEYIYSELIKHKELDIRRVLDVKEGYLSCLKYGYYLATSKVVLVDDYIATIYNVPRRKDNYLIQVWHACGAFKTFGFSRLGKPGGQKQKSYAHRNYDFCTVSSKEIRKYYAEGFGLSLEKIIATGVPRTDMFFSDEYKERARKDFYARYPHLKGKKIVLFAPTFRGNGKKTGYYPESRFDFIKLYEYFNKEYAIIIKHHPFVNNRIEIPKEYSEYIIDMSDNEELNDLLFVTDVLITDYSSVVFEASLLDIPMLFYAFDLQSYISSRGFYYEYDDFVPGKIVSNMGDIIKSVEDKDFEAEKIDAFKHRFFDELDGRAGYRVANLIIDLIKNRR